MCFWDTLDVRKPQKNGRRWLFCQITFKIFGACGARKTLDLPTSVSPTRGVVGKSVSPTRGVVVRHVPVVGHRGGYFAFCGSIDQTIQHTCKFFHLPDCTRLQLTVWCSLVQTATSGLVKVVQSGQTFRHHYSESVMSFLTAIVSDVHGIKAFTFMY